jgi:hypothetical protein
MNLCAKNWLRDYCHVIGCKFCMFSCVHMCVHVCMRVYRVVQEESPILQNNIPEVKLRYIDKTKNTCM